MAAPRAHRGLLALVLLLPACATRQPPADEPEPWSLRKTCPSLFAPTAKARIDASDIKHGRAELRRAFAHSSGLDFSELDSFVPVEGGGYRREVTVRHPELVEWTVRQLAGESISARIEIEPSESNPTVGGRRAWHQKPSAGDPRGHIGLVPSQEGLEGQWFTLIFELHNIRWGKRQRTILRKVVSGELSRAEASEQMAEGELWAIRETARFLAKHWDPWAKANGRHTSARMPMFAIALRARSRAEFQAIRGEVVPGYPESIFGPQFDRMRRECTRPGQKPATN